MLYCYIISLRRNIWLLLADTSLSSISQKVKPEVGKVAVVRLSTSVSTSTLGSITIRIPQLLTGLPLGVKVVVVGGSVDAIDSWTLSRRVLSLLVVVVVETVGRFRRILELNALRRSLAGVDDPPAPPCWMFGRLSIRSGGWWYLWVVLNEWESDFASKASSMRDALPSTACGGLW